VSEIRVRFAPSPTGYLHIGSVRTALFNYLFAKAQQGDFFLRMEDTDRERSRPEYEQEILKGLEWLGLHHDGPMVRQSDRFEHYRKMARSLVDRGKAFVTTEKGGEAVIYCPPAMEVRFHDLVHGEIRFDASSLGDLVLIKSDGTPAYNFACVIDDHDMRITHVIRGDDHSSNTPKQILLYEVYAFPAPQFAHLPLILGQDGAPLSKRHGSVSLRAHQEEGFLAEALINYLALLGWNPGDDQEIFSLDEMIKRFSLSKVNSNPATFDDPKLRWMNGEHIRALDDASYRGRLLSYLGEFGGLGEAWKADFFPRAAVLFKGRIKTFKEFLSEADYFFKDPPVFDPAAVKKHWKDEGVKENFEKLAAELETVDFEEPQAIEACVRNFAGRLGVAAGVLIHPLRVALTGRSVSPGLFELMAALGKRRVLARVGHASQHFEELKELHHG
jgi:glutamyl-tRNA synthetase